jgi:hypothetical protein
LFFLLVLVASHAHASSISGTMAFEVTLDDDPLNVGVGSLQLAHGRIVDFEFEMFGFTFDEGDMDRACRCSVYGDDMFIGLRGVFGTFAWDFEDGIFAGFFSYGGYDFGGTSEGGGVSGILTSQNLRAVPEPATAGLLAACVLLLLVISRADGYRRR